MFIGTARLTQPDNLIQHHPLNLATTKHSELNDSDAPNFSVCGPSDPSRSPFPLFNTQAKAMAGYHLSEQIAASLD
jgi:hypothetical protein